MKRPMYMKAAAAAWALLMAVPGLSGESWTYHIAGDAADVSTNTSGLLVLQGGGDWIDENYTAMAKAGGYGDFVVLRASGAGEYSEYLFNICRCDSVETLVFHDRSAAFNDEVIATIRRAEALFIAGGDQARYYRFWRDTPVERAINELARRPVPIGGTSAGMAVLGEFLYTATGPASLTSKGALSDPFHHDLTIARDFLELPGLRNTITDQHLEERDRIGRTIGLLARLLHEGWTDDARAIAADRETALHLDPATGIGRVFATQDHETPYVYFLRLGRLTEALTPGLPLATGDVQVHRIGPGETFDITNWEPGGGETYRLRSVGGELTSSTDSLYGSREP